MLYEVITVTVAAKITARVKEMLVEEGMQVEAGQVSYNFV